MWPRRKQARPIESAVSTTEQQHKRAGVSAPSILYLPASGPAGVGEYMRCLLLARAVARRWPGARARFMVNRHASYASSIPYPTVLLDTSPTHAVTAVTAVIRDERPDIVIFDNSGRVAQLETAREVGAATVFVSSRPNSRRKGLRLRRIRLLDQHWIPQPAWATDPPSAWESFKKRYLSRVETLYLGAMFEEDGPAERQQLRESLQLGAAPYLVFTAGGGGKFSGRANASELLLSAAAAIAAATARRCIVVLGPNYEGSASAPAGVTTVRQLPNASLMALLRGADLVVTGGGAVLLQALALGKLCVAVPIAGDQSARIERARALDLLVATPLDVAAVTRATLDLIGAPARQAAMTAAIGRLGLRNGLGTALDALAKLL